MSDVCVLVFLRIRVHSGVIIFVSIQTCREVKIGDYKSEFFVYQKVFRLDVSVYEALSVQVFQSFDELLEQVPYEPFGESFVVLN